MPLSPQTILWDGCSGTSSSKLMKEMTMLRKADHGEAPPPACKKKMCEKKMYYTVRYNQLQINVVGPRLSGHYHYCYVQDEETQHNKSDD